VAVAEQKFAFLRHVEALRLYAAEHRGQLPEKLTDLAVPLPVDPLSGQPFRYSREGNVAHLRGSSPPHSHQDRALNRHYEITMAPFLEAK
jgi:hypothetical protein